MWKRMRDLLGGFVLGGVLVGVLVGASAQNMDLAQIVPFRAQSLWLMKQARAILETYQVDGETPVSEDVLVQGAIKGMVAAWGDPYTRYVDPKQLKEEEIEMEGEYGGLGIYIGQRDGRTLVISPIEGTPADRVGLKPKDEIVKIGDEVIMGWDQDQVVKNLRGAPNTSVTVWVRREGEDQLLRFDIVREIIKIKSVRSEILSDDLAYIRLVHFNQKTTEELRNALEQTRQSKARGIILDLRNNPGGLLNTAVEVADMFLDGGLVVGMKGRVARANDELFARPGVRTHLPLVVLINEGSASASEIVAGALKDRGRAKVVGQKSFGKGSVQTLFPLPDGSGVYVTIARYYNPSGRVIDHVGLEPDILVEGEMDRDHDKDEQLKRAVEELKALLSAR
ncbi:S41 family peptidase [Aminiphilus circumscriptus]|jgi:carboxyl-terminal processing protease|uniref:S41 family peptidase n=1 Tax=Aminiphilus circumscriptus TaxID=290732 RepID=UPI0004928B26|nr:S41 family peptidase [Aminiphilus circumscriptus]